MRIGILNAYDARNRGDYAIVLCMISWLRRLFPAVEISVFSDYYKNNSAFFPGLSSRPLGWKNPDGGRLSKSFVPFFEITIGFFGLEKFFREFRNFRQCSVFAVCGGGAFYSSARSFVSRHLILVCLQSILAAFRTSCCIVFPQTFGPFHKRIDLFFVRLLLRRCLWVCARSEKSLNLVLKIEPKTRGSYVPDLVLAARYFLPDLFSDWGFDRDGMGVAPVNPVFVPGFNNEDRLSYLVPLADLCSRWHQRKGGLIRVFTQVSVPGDNDEVAVNLLTKCLEARCVPFEIFAPSISLEDYLKGISRCRVFVGCRMHSCIFSLNYLVPTLALSYQQKFFDLFDSLELSRWAKPLNDWSVNWAEQQLFSADENYDKYQTFLKAKLETQKQLILKGLAPISAIMSKKGFC